MKTIGKGLRWCVSFRGRATRKEFWLLFLAVAAVSVPAVETDFTPLMVLYLLMLVPMVAVGVRRLHDLGRRGGWLWLAISALGLIALLIMLSDRGQPHANRFGPPPGAGDLAGTPAAG
ncbi:DUF805 domain-containing protein [Amycolatopsis sp. NEAU-NG30]|uniref:DUF805 domain-containing protein n=1 Tax=Amycolatopsis melonis TaxID=3156488 RepID=A0ABV0LRD9_9PSEU